MKYYMLNKPRGVVTARRDDQHKTVMDCFPEEWRDVIHPVGRLDLDTEGLLILTDDGYLDPLLMQPGAHVEKEYLFGCFGSLDAEGISRLESGVELCQTGHISTPARVGEVTTMHVSDVGERLDIRQRMRWLRNPEGLVSFSTLTITEEKKHQVKLMLKAVGCKVFELKRIRIGGLNLDESLMPGEWRELTADELELLVGGNFVILRENYGKLKSRNAEH